MIVLNNLVKTYSSGVEALKGLNLQIAEGEIFGFLGSNGAGKSTAIKMMTTLSRPTSGELRIAGIDPVKKATLVREKIGYVAQEAGVDYFLTGRENLTLQGRLYHLPGHLVRERVEELLSLFELGKYADQMVSTYSGGMQRKLDIATALVHRPKLLFMDEPTLGLDPRSRLALWDYIRKLNRDFGMTIFLTTHYLEEAEKLAGRIGILDGGELKVVGTPDRLKSEMGGDSVNFVCESTQARSEQAEKWNQFNMKPYVDHLVFDRNEVRLYVRKDKDALLKVMSDADNLRLNVETISFSRATLDDVFLKYTGKSMENKGDEAESEPWWKKWQKSGQGSDEWKKWAGGDEGGADDSGGGRAEQAEETGTADWRSGKWTEAEMKEWWANKSKAK